MNDRDEYRPAKPPTPRGRTVDAPKRSRMPNADEVLDEALEESFPASDVPASGKFD